LLHELANQIRDAAEAARLLASSGDYLAAAERCLADEAFINRATLSQLQQLHAWLLRVGKVDAARQAVSLWDSLVAQGRVQEDIVEAQAAARLALGRALLRKAADAQPPILTAPKADASADADAQGKQKGHRQRGNYKAVAGAASEAVRIPCRAALPIASIAGIHLSVQQQPERADLADLISEAVRTLSDAQQGFINSKQPAGVLEALSWGLAAKAPGAITVGQWQLAGVDGGSRLCDALEVVGHTQQAVALLQALASTVKEVKGRRMQCGHAPAKMIGSNLCGSRSCLVRAVSTDTSRPRLHAAHVNSQVSH
jgi:hypothetical protein